MFYMMLEEYDYDLVARGGGDTPLYGVYSYVRPQRVWLFSRLGWKYRYWSQIGYGFCTVVLNWVSMFLEEAILCIKIHMLIG